MIGDDGGVGIGLWCSLVFLHNMGRSSVNFRLATLKIGMCGNGAMVKVGSCANEGILRGYGFGLVWFGFVV